MLRKSVIDVRKERENWNKERKEGNKSLGERRTV